MTALDLAALERLERMASAIPWAYGPDKNGGARDITSGTDDSYVCGNAGLSDASIVAAARNALPQLLAIVRAGDGLAEECRVRHPGEDNPLAWALAKYEEARNG